MKHARLLIAALGAALAAPLATGCAAATQTTPTPTSAKPAAQAPAAVDRSRLPLPQGDAPEWAPPVVQTWTMPNGLEVYYLKQDQAPLASVSLVLRRGAATDPAAKAGLTSLTADMLDEGAGRLGALELSEALQRLATDYAAGADTDTVTVRMNLLADKLDPSLALMRDIVMAPTFAPAEYERRKAQRIATALADEAAPPTGRGNVLRTALFGDGYAGTAADGTRATLERITLADVKQHYKALFAPKGAAMVVVGDLERAEVEAALTKHFGAWKGAPTATPRKVAAPRIVPAIHVVDYPGAAQSAIAVARRAGPMPRGEAVGDYFDALVMNRVLGGAFTARVNMNLREDKGYTYGARTDFVRYREAGFWLAYAGVESPTTRASLDEIFKEIAEIKDTRPISAEELEQASGGLLLGYPGQFETMGAVAGQISTVAGYPLPNTWLTAYPSRVEAVTLSAAQGSANTFLDPKQMIVVVAGDLKAIRAELEGLGLPIYEYDAQGRRLKK